MIKDEIIFDSIQAWLRTVAESVSVGTPQSIHIDHLFNQEIEPSHSIILGVRALSILITQVVRWKENVQPGLVIPLRTKGRFLEGAAPNSLSDIVNDLHDMEPPSLYLLDWESRKYLFVREQYECPLSGTTLQFGDPLIYVFYRESRAPSTGRGSLINKDWEFVRGVHAEWYPARYRINNSIFVEA